MITKTIKLLLLVSVLSSGCSIFNKPDTVFVRPQPETGSVEKPLIHEVNRMLTELSIYSPLGTAVRPKICFLPIDDETMVAQRLNQLIFSRLLKRTSWRQVAPDLADYKLKLIEVEPKEQQVAFVMVLLNNQNQVIWKFNGQTKN